MPSLFDQFLVLKPDQRLDQLEVRPDLYQRLDERYDAFRSHALVAAHRFTQDWPTWECHPAGDELVVLLSGSVSFVLRFGSGDESVELSEPGTFVVVPKGTWHTARVAQAASLLFLTPGEGTRNEPTPPGDATGC